MQDVLIIFSCTQLVKEKTPTDPIKKNPHSNFDLNVLKEHYLFIHLFLPLWPRIGFILLDIKGHNIKNKNEKKEKKKDTASNNSLDFLVGDGVRGRGSFVV